MRFSVLDLFSTPLVTIDLVVRCEELGFYRYWVGEHHNSQQCCNPILLSGVLQGLTDHIRIGTGAVGLYGRSPFLVAEDARLVTSLYGERFDLGVTRGLAFASRRTSRYILDGRDVEKVREQFDQRLDQLHAFITGRPNATVPEIEHVYLDIAPPMWLVATNAPSAEVAARLGIGLCTSLHHAKSRQGIRDAIAAYRDGFEPSEEFPEPQVILVQSGFCRATEERARRAFESFMTPPPGVKIRPGAAVQTDHLFVGDPAQCGEMIRGTLRDLAPDEMMLLDLNTEEDNMVEGLQLLAGQLIPAQAAARGSA